MSHKIFIIVAIVLSLPLFADQRRTGIGEAIKDLGESSRIVSQSVDLGRPIPFPDRSTLLEKFDGFLKNDVRKSDPIVIQLAVDSLEKREKQEGRWLQGIAHRDEVTEYILGNPVLAKKALGAMQEQNFISSFSNQQQKESAVETLVAYLQEQNLKLFAKLLKAARLKADPTK